jgi:hypothetical protein
MADPATIAELRRLIDEPTPETFTDEVLSARIDAEPGDLRVLASTIWREKAAQYAGLVDVKEGNSDRKLSQLYKNALEMATSLGGADAVIVGSGRPTRTRKIERM